RYEVRPSAWVEPQGDWGKGHVVLVQLPTPNETNDNIVAFWTPAAKPQAQQAASYDYRITFGGATIAGETMGKVVSTFLGDGNRIGGGNAPGAYRVLVDFADGALAKLPARSMV